MPAAGAPPGAMPDTGLRFAPELFECHSEAQTALANEEILWLSHYSSVDPLHDLCGLEVRGIKDEETADRIAAALRRRFPTWPYCSAALSGCWGGKEPGWVAYIHRSSPSTGSGGGVPH